MALFGREDRSPSPPAEETPSAASPPPSSGAGRARRTHIAAGLRVEGKLSGADQVEIDGTVAGEVVVDGAVVIGEEGRVEGRLEARQVTVHGRLQGNLYAAERAEVSASGRVEGDIEAPRVIIAEGAYFKGNVKMGQPAQQAAARKGQT